MKHLFAGLTAAALCALLLLFPRECREGAARGLENCLSVLVPSLFPLMAATRLAVTSGACRRAAAPLRPVTRALFGLDGALAPVLLLSLVGGYPVGAVGIAALYRQGAIRESEAQRAALFAVCAGPGFTVSFIGQALYGSAALGMLLLAAQATAVILTGIVLHVFWRPPAETPAAPPKSVSAVPFSQAIVEAVGSAARGMASVCAFVVLFSAINGVAARFLTLEPLCHAVWVLTEVCGAVTALAGRQPLWLTAFAVGYGGLCVHCQIFGILGSIKVNKLLFFLVRVIQGGMTALLTQLGLRLFPQTAAVFSTAPKAAPALIGGSVASGAVLLAVSICFFISVRQTIRKTS